MPSNPEEKQPPDPVIGYTFLCAVCHSSYFTFRGYLSHTAPVAPSAPQRPVAHSHTYRIRAAQGPGLPRMPMPTSPSLRKTAPSPTPRAEKTALSSLNCKRPHHRGAPARCPLPCAVPVVAPRAPTERATLRPHGHEQPEKRRRAREPRRPHESCEPRLRSTRTCP